MYHYDWVSWNPKAIVSVYDLYHALRPLVNGDPYIFPLKFSRFLVEFQRVCRYGEARPELYSEVPQYLIAAGIKKAVGTTHVISTAFCLRSGCLLWHSASFGYYLSFKHHGWWAEPGSCQQQVEVGPFEHQLGHMVDLGVFQQAERTDGGEGILAGKRFSVVVEVDDVGFPEA